MSGLKVGTTQVPHQRKKKGNPGPGARGNQFALEDRYLCTNVMAWTPYRMHVASRQLSPAGPHSNMGWQSGAGLERQEKSQSWPQLEAWGVTGQPSRGAASHCRKALVTQLWIFLKPSRLPFDTGRQCLFWKNAIKQIDHLSL